MVLARPSRPALFVLAAVCVVAAVWIQWQGRGTIWFYDEWNFILDRRGASADSLLRGHNGHLSVVPVLIYKALLQTVGLDAYWPYRLVLTVTHLFAAVAVFALARRRAGDGAAVLAAALVLGLGAAWDDFVWAFQIGFVGSVAAGLAMLLALDREGRRADVLAAIALATSLACSSIGVAFAIAGVAELVLARRWRALAAVAAVPLGLYGAWRLGYGESDLRASNLDEVPRYAYEMAAGAAGGLVGLGQEAGRMAALVLVAALLVVLARGVPRMTPRLGGLLAGMLALWALTALARAQLGEPASPRYVYPGAVLVLMALFELWPRGAVLRGRALAAAGVAVGVAVWGNTTALIAGADGLRAHSQALRAELGALELTVPPAELQPVPERDPQITAFRYLEAARDFGSPALTDAELARAPASDRAAADAALARAAELRTASVPAFRDKCSRVPSGTVYSLEGGPDAIVIAAPPTGDVEIRARHFASVFGEQPTYLVPAGATVALVSALLRRGDDSSGRSWSVELRGRDGLRACRVKIDPNIR